MASVELPQCVADVTAMVDGLKQTNECIALERDRIDKSLGEMEHIKDRFEDRCIQICSNIRTELDRLPKLSRITLDDEVIPIITLSVPYIREDMYKDRMYISMRRCRRQKPSILRKTNSNTSRDGFHGSGCSQS